MSNTLPTEFVFDDGFKRYPLKNMLGMTIGTIGFNPADTGLFSRYDKLVEEINAIEIDENASMDEQIKVADKELIKAFGTLLNNNNVSEELFGMYTPMTVFVDGRFYAECLVETIGSIIEAETGNRLKKKIAKIKKNTANKHK